MPSPTCHHAKLPLTRIDVVGCGGNGSIFATHLCRIHQAWTALGGEPFKIVLWDPDVVTEANLARQVFCAQDLGSPKAMVLASRMSTFFGINSIEWKTKKFVCGSTLYGPYESDVMVGCVDNLEARRTFAKFIQPATHTQHQWGEDHERKTSGCYWLDLGNTDHSGQVVLGGHGLPTLFDVLPQLRKAKDPKNLPSCSMAESLSRQDLFINSTVATLAANLLWQLMRHGRIEHHGYFINLQSGRVAPIPVPCQTNKTK